MTGTRELRDRRNEEDERNLPAAIKKVDILMEIRPSSNIEAKPLHLRESSVKEPGKKMNFQDEISTESTQQSRDLLANVDEVRPDVVAKGKELLASPDYPSSDVVEGIAKVFVEQKKES